MDIVSSAVLDIIHKNPGARMGTGLFDLGSLNMSNLFYFHEDTFAISQLPYYQSAIPVFLLYIRVKYRHYIKVWSIYSCLFDFYWQYTTGNDPFINQTIPTGPNLVTNSTLNEALEAERATLLPLQEISASVGAIIPNVNGDTYEASLLAGMYDLAQKLNWSIVKADEDRLTGPFFIMLPCYL